MRAPWLLTVLTLAAPVWAQSVAVNGTLGNKALLLIDGAAPKAVAVGEEYHGIKVLAVQDNQVTLEQGGKRQVVRVGDAPASVGSQAGDGVGGTRVVLTADGGGHFMSQGQINGHAVQFMVDTGATFVAMSTAEAQRIGLSFQTGQALAIQTANGSTPGWRVTLHAVRLGDVTVNEVEAVVSPGAMPFVLLGNSYLNRFQMNRTNDQMVLERRF